MSVVPSPKGSSCLSNVFSRGILSTYLVFTAFMIFIIFQYLIFGAATGVRCFDNYIYIIMLKYLRDHPYFPSHTCKCCPFFISYTTVVSSIVCTIMAILYRFCACVISNTHSLHWPLTKSSKWFFLLFGFPVIRQWISIWSMGQAP